MPICLPKNQDPRCLIAPLMGFLLLVGAVQADDPPLEPVKVDCGLSSTDFGRVNEADAKAAFKAYSEIVARQIGYDVEFVTHIFRDPSELEHDLQKGLLELLSIEVQWYLQETVSRYVKPALVPEESPGVILDTYVLLTHRLSGLAEISDLQGKKVAFLEHENATLARVWLDVLLMTHDISTSENCLRETRVTHKPSAAVLPVFFRTIDACVVDRSSFEVMCELNPQVGQQLRIMAESEPLLDTVLCLNPSGSLTLKQERDMDHVLKKLQDSPQGKQILMIFGINRFVPFEEKYLESARNLLENYTSLHKKHEKLALDMGSTPSLVEKLTKRVKPNTDPNP